MKKEYILMPVEVWVQGTEIMAIESPTVDQAAETYKIVKKFYPSKTASLIAYTEMMDAEMLYNNINTHQMNNDKN
jgi:hypothetical protein